MIGRLVLVGGILVDVAMALPALPEPGGDVLATDSLVSTGGGFVVLAAARRQGLPAAYLGPHGTGAFADRIRADLAREGVDVLLPPVADGDNGFCVGLIDDSGERTYVTRTAVEGRMTAADLAGFHPAAGDAVYLSGYELAYPHGPLLTPWFAALPSAATAVFDPGPLAGTLDAALLDPVVRRADWVSLNAREARILTGEADAVQAAATWARRFGVPAGGLVVRDGAEGCVVLLPGADPVRVPGERVEHPLDTSGAGDTHVGAFLAALGHGLDPLAAAAVSNRAAAWTVQRFGAANAPTLAESDPAGSRAAAPGAPPPPASMAP